MWKWETVHCFYEFKFLVLRHSIPFFQLVRLRKGPHLRYRKTKTRIASLCGMKTWGNGCSAPVIFTLGPRCGVWSASCPSSFSSMESSPSTPWIGGWVGIRGGLDILEKRYVSCTCWELNHHFWDVWHIAWNFPGSDTYAEFVHGTTLALAGFVGSCSWLG